MTNYDTFDMIGTFSIMHLVVMGFMFLTFAVVFIMILVMIFRKTNTTISNNNAPRITVDAVVIAKRQETNRVSENYTNTNYFVTFQADDGRRVELQMEGGQYGLLIEGDYGKLTFQGTRYLGFVRT